MTRFRIALILATLMLATIGLDLPVQSGAAPALAARHGSEAVGITTARKIEGNDNKAV